MKKSTGKFISFILLLLVAFGIIWFLDLYRFTPQQIRAFILSFGVWGPILYIFLYTIRPLVFFPAAVLTLSGGLAFGPWWGTFYGVIGASLGAYLSFFLARSLGREMIQRWLGNRLQNLDDRVEKYGFRTILFLRFIPLIPFDAVSYSAGLTKVRFYDYALGTTLGMIPGAFAYNFLGHSLHEVFSYTFFLALAFVLLLFALPLLYKGWKK